MSKICKIFIGTIALLQMQGTANAVTITPSGNTNFSGIVQVSAGGVTLTCSANMMLNASSGALIVRSYELSSGACGSFTVTGLPYNVNITGFGGSYNLNIPVLSLSFIIPPYGCSGPVGMVWNGSTINVPYQAVGSCMLSGIFSPNSPFSIY